MNNRRKREAVREKPLSCAVDPNPHFLANCFDAGHALKLGRDTVRTAGEQPDGLAAAQAPETDPAASD